MMNGCIVMRGLLAVCLCLIAASSAWADHHLMQIHQVMGGVNGDVTAQAVQLRMRGPFQNQMQASKLWVHDAAGENSILLIDFDHPVTNGFDGDTVLVVSENFVSQTDPTCEPDFILTNLIPESYLAAGSLTFENNLGETVWWRLSWGGENYTGPTTGALTNDADGDFGVYPDPLPREDLRALLFQGEIGDKSTNNADDYDLTAGAAVYTNNAHSNFEVVGAGQTEVCPASQTILAGIQSNGGFGDVCASDNVRSVYQSTTFAAVFSPAPIQVQFDGNFAGAGDALTFNMEGHPTFGSGSAFLTLQLWNYTTGLFTSMPFINQPDGTDSLYSHTVDNSAGDYVDTNGDVRALVTAAKTQDGPVRLNTDQVYWSD